MKDTTQLETNYCLYGIR